jgi:hypothetical protein
MAQRRVKKHRTTKASAKTAKTTTNPGLRLAIGKKPDTAQSHGAAIAPERLWDPRTGASHLDPGVA